MGTERSNITGLKYEASLSMITAKGVNKMIKKDEFRVACFCITTMDSQKDIETVEQLGLRALLQEFQDVFKEPTDLPPTRGAEHHINLKEEVSHSKCSPIGTLICREMR